VDTVEKNSTSIFSSQHLYLVAFLVCAGHGIADIVRNGRRVSFEFAQTPELLTDVAGFMSGASVPARQFSFELLKLKRMLNGSIAGKSAKSRLTASASRATGGKSVLTTGDSLP
jgi:hypothetical protein